MYLPEAMPRGAAAGGRPEKLLSICFVAPHAWPVLSGDSAIPVVGGAEVQQCILARLFARHGHRVSMICLDYGQSDRAVVDGVRVLKAFGVQDGLPVLRFVHPRLTSMWRALREADADLYYYRSASMWVGVTAEFCRRHGRRAIYAGASDRDFLPRQGGQIRYARDRWLFRRGIARVHAIVAQNEVQRLSCRKTYGREAVVIPSCYPLARHHCAEQKDLVLWVGTVHANKRPGLLLDLAERLPQRRFVMIGGPGADPAFYESIRARAAGIANLEFKGFLPLAEVERWFDRARVLVNTSLFEGMPNTFLQAWARGVPTASFVRVAPQVNRVAADANALAESVEFLFQHPEAGQRCREYFERTHSTAHVLQRYTELFAGVAA